LKKKGCKESKKLPLCKKVEMMLIQSQKLMNLILMKKQLRKLRKLKAKLSLIKKKRK